MGSTASAVSIQNPSTETRANVVATTSDPTKNGLVIVNADGTPIGSGKYLKIDQTTPETVINGVPIFQQGVQTGLTDGTSGGNITAKATLGAELFTSFNRANRTLTSGWESTNDGDTQLNKNADGVTTATLNTVAPTIGKTYKITFTAGTVSGSTFIMSFGARQTPTIGNAGTYTYYITATSTGLLTITPTATALRATITAISIKEVTVNTGSAIIEKDIFLGGDLKKPDGTVIMQADGRGSTNFPGIGTANFAGNLGIAGALSGATTIASSGTNTNTQLTQGVKETGESFVTTNTSASSVNVPVQHPVRNRRSGTAWDTANRTINWIQNVWINAQASIASRMKWSYDFNAGGYNEIMNLENNGTLNLLGTTLGTESLTNPNLTGGTSRARTGDMALTSDTAVYTHSTGAGTLIQTQANLAVALVGSRWYKFTFTTTANSGTVTPTIYIPNTVALNTTQISEGINGTYSIYFKTIASPTDFVVSGISGQTGAVTLDTFSLKEVSGGNIYSDTITTKAISTPTGLYQNGLPQNDYPITLSADTTIANARYSEIYDQIVIPSTYTLYILGNGSLVIQ